MKSVLKIFILVAFSLKAFGVENTSSARLTDPKARQVTQVGYSFSHFAYREPGLMSTTGQFHGVAGRFKQLTETGKTFIIEGELMMGGTRYEGSTMKGKPVDAKGQDAWVGLRALVAASPSLSSMLRPMAGLGYRDHINRIEGPGSYTREITYFYLPAGLFGERQFATKANWALGYRLEADLLLSGRVRSHLDEASSQLETIENKQRFGSGYGFQIEASVTYQMTATAALTLTPYFQSWKIETSEPASTGGKTFVEPDNETDIFGIKASVLF